MPFFIKIEKNSFRFYFTDGAVFIDYSNPKWLEREEQQRLKNQYWKDTNAVERLIKHHPKETSDIIRSIFYKLMTEIDFPKHTVYVKPTLKEVLDIYNGVINYKAAYDDLEVKSRFEDIRQMSEEYAGLINENKKLREDYKKEEQERIDSLMKEISLSNNNKAPSNTFNEVKVFIKDKYNPLFRDLYNRMRNYSDEARKFFYKDENWKDLDWDMDVNWAELKNNYTNWDHFFYFSNFSPFEKNIKEEPIDTSPSDEDIIMRALKNGDGDRFGY